MNVRITGPKRIGAGKGWRILASDGGPVARRLSLAAANWTLTFQPLTIRETEGTTKCINYLRTKPTFPRQENKRVRGIVIHLAELACRPGGSSRCVSQYLRKAGIQRRKYGDYKSGNRADEGGADC